MKGKKLLLLLSLLPMFLVSIGVLFLPSRIPMHYDWYGAITRMGSKFELYIVAAMMAVVGVVYLLISNYYVATKNYSEKELEIIYYLLNVVGILMNTMLLFIIVLSSVGGRILVFGYGIGSGRILYMLLGGMLLAMSPKLAQVPLNSAIGIRLPWTMKNEASWVVSQGLCAKYFTVMGGLMILVSGIIPERYTTLSGLMILVVGVIVLMIDTYRKTKYITS